jgi:hypothetical protein
MAANLSMASHAWYPLFTLSSRVLPLDKWASMLGRYVEPHRGRLAVPRDVLKRPVSLGGLQMVDFHLQAQAIQAHALVRALTQPQLPWAALFLRSVARAATLTRLRHTFGPLAYPSALVSQLRKHGFAGEALAAFNRLHWRFHADGSAPDTLIMPDHSTARLDALSVRTIRNLLMQSTLRIGTMVSPPPAGPVTNPPRLRVSWAKRWTGLAHFAPMTPQVRELRYRMWHGRTALGFSLANVAAAPPCPLCGATESQAHLWRSCPFAAAVLNHLIDWMSPPGRGYFSMAAVRTAWSLDHAPFKMGKPAFAALTLAVSLVRYRLWTVRCHCLYDGEPAPSPLGVWRMALHDIRLSLRVVVATRNDEWCELLANQARWLVHRQGTWQCVL